jgi:hypothetical protein
MQEAHTKPLNFIDPGFYRSVFSPERIGKWDLLSSAPGWLFLGKPALRGVLLVFAVCSSLAAWSWRGVVKEPDPAPTVLPTRKLPSAVGMSGEQ